MRAETLCLATAAFLAAQPIAAQQPTEASLRAADAEQMRIIIDEDAKAQQEFMHPNYMLNGPANAVKRKAEVVSLLAQGQIASERFTRKVEGVAITGNVGIVMGSEVVTPAVNSNLGRLHPGRTLDRRYTNVFIWKNGGWKFLARQASIVSPSAPVALPSIAQLTPPAMHVGVPGRCEEQARNGGGAEGCFLNATLPLGRLGPQHYWHIDRFPDAASAQAANTAHGAVTTALGGQIFLQTVTDDAGWKARGGERLTTVGPLAAPADAELTARFMEATTSMASSTFPHSHSGPEGFFLLEGSICVETPVGAHRAASGRSLVLPGGVPMQLSHAGQTVRRSLVLVVHPSTSSWIDRHPQWKPAGACRL